MGWRTAGQGKRGVLLYAGDQPLTVRLNDGATAQTGREGRWAARGRAPALNDAAKADVGRVGSVHRCVFELLPF